MNTSAWCPSESDLLRGPATLVRTNLAASAAETDPVGEEIFAICHGFTEWTPSTFMILLFPILAVLLAYAFKSVLDHYRLPVPYTFPLVIAGGIFGVAGCYLNLAQLSASLNYWVDVRNPEVLFYVLLPPLILESALFIDWWTVSNLLLQIFALSMILVVIDAALLAFFTTYVLTDSPWSLNAGWMFGALISPTDVLAVNMALEGSGIRTPLQVMIQGESLFNDGSGFTLFVLFLTRLQPNASQSIGAIFVQLLRLAGGGLALGIAFALPTLVFLRRVWKDAAIEIGSTFVLSYLVFYVGESPCGVSGIVAVASFGLVLRADRFASLTPEFQDSLLAFWSVISMIINAIAFTYAGFIAVVNLIVFWGRHGIDGKTIAYGLVLYPVLYLSRLIAVVVLYPVLRRSRYGLTWREALLIVHVGLRGAISLIAAQIVFHEPNIQGGTYVNARVQLWTATIVLMTLMVQAPTIKTVAGWLGLLNRSAAQVRTFRAQVRRLHAKALDILLDMQRTSRFTFADWVFVGQVAILPAELSRLLLRVGQVRALVSKATRTPVLMSEHPDSISIASDTNKVMGVSSSSDMEERLPPQKPDEAHWTASAAGPELMDINSNPSSSFTPGTSDTSTNPKSTGNLVTMPAPGSTARSTMGSTFGSSFGNAAGNTMNSAFGNNSGNSAGNTILATATATTAAAAATATSAAWRTSDGTMPGVSARLQGSLPRSSSLPQLVVARPPRVSLAVPRASVEYRMSGSQALRERHSREMQRLSRSLQLERQHQVAKARNRWLPQRPWWLRLDRKQPRTGRSRRMTAAAAGARPRSVRWTTATTNIGPERSAVERSSILQRRRRQQQQHSRRYRRPPATAVFLHQLNESRRRALLAMRAAVQKQFLIGSMSMTPYRLLNAAIDRSMDEVSNPTNTDEIRVFSHTQAGGWGLSRLEQFIVGICGRFRFLHRFARWLIYRRLFIGYDIVSGLTVALVHALHSRHAQQAERWALEKAERSPPGAATVAADTAAVVMVHSTDWVSADPHGSLTLIADLQVAIELEAEVARCESYLHSSRVLSPETVRASDSLHAANVLLSRQARLIEELYATGTLTEAESKALLDQLDMRREALQRVSIRFPLPTIGDCLRNSLASWLEVEYRSRVALEHALEQLLAAWRAAGQIRAFAHGEVVQRMDTLVVGVFYVIRGAIEVRTQHVEFAGDDLDDLDEQLLLQRQDMQAVDHQARHGTLGRHNGLRSSCPAVQRTPVDRIQRQSAMIANLLSEEEFPPLRRKPTTTSVWPQAVETAETGSAAPPAGVVAPASSERSTEAPLTLPSHLGQERERKSTLWRRWRWWQRRQPEETAATPRDMVEPPYPGEEAVPSATLPSRRRAAEARLRAFISDVFGIAGRRERDDRYTSNSNVVDDDDDDLADDGTIAADAEEAVWHAASAEAGAFPHDLRDAAPSSRALNHEHKHIPPDLEASAPASGFPREDAHEVRTLSNSVTGQSYGMAGSLYRYTSALELVVVSQLAHVFFIPASNFRNLMSSRDDWMRLAVRMAASECARNLVPNVEEYLTETRMRFMELERRDRPSTERQPERSSTSVQSPADDAETPPESNGLAAARTDTLGADNAAPESAQVTRPGTRAHVETRDTSSRLPDASFAMYENPGTVATETMLFPPEALDYEKRRDAMLLPLRTATLVVWAMPRLLPGTLSGPLHGQCIARRLRSAVVILLQGTVYLQTCDGEGARQLQHARPLCKRYGCLGQYQSELHAPCETLPVRCRVLVVTPSDTPLFFDTKAQERGEAGLYDEQRAENEALWSLLHSTAAANPAAAQTVSSGGLRWHPPDPNLITVAESEGASSGTLLRRRVDAPALIRLDVAPALPRSVAPETNAARTGTTGEASLLSDANSRSLSMGRLGQASIRVPKRLASPLDLYSGERKLSSRAKQASASAEQFTLVWFDPADPRIHDLVAAFGVGPGGVSDPLFEDSLRSRPLSRFPAEDSITSVETNAETARVASEAPRTAEREQSASFVSSGPVRLATFPSEGHVALDTGDANTFASSSSESTPDLSADVRLMADRHLLS